MNPDLLKNVITKKTKAIMPVHLTGRISEMSKIMKIAQEYNIPVIEDAAQSVGSLYKNKPAGSFGKIGCFSAHPLKNLNAIGDAGFLTTSNIKIYNTIMDLKNHGMTSDRNKIKKFGYVSRMDNLQAAVLNYRLIKLNKVIAIRRKNVQYYKKYLNPDNVFVPDEELCQFNTYHTFVIQVNKRDQLKEYLKKNGIVITFLINHTVIASKIISYLTIKKIKICSGVLCIMKNQFMNLIRRNIRIYFKSMIFTCCGCLT